MSFMESAARCNAFRVAGTGPTPMYAGSTPIIAVETILANGFRLNFFKMSSLTIKLAAAPSFYSH